MTTPGGLLYAENALLRVVDPRTGELRWSLDPHEQTEEVGFLDTGLTSANATDEHLLPHFEGGLLRMSPQGEVVDHFPLPECQGNVNYPWLKPWACG